MNKTILGHIQVSIDLHGCPNAGMANGFGEGCQIEVGIIFMLDVVVGHIGVPKTMDGDIVSQSDLLTDLPVALAGAAADTAAEGEIGGSADILMFATDGIVLSRYSAGKRSKTRENSRSSQIGENRKTVANTVLFAIQ